MTIAATKSIEKEGETKKVVNVDEKVTIKLTHHETVTLPVKGERNVLITSALPYVNNVPHLGNIIGCVLSADVFARYSRLRGYNTLYISGTDEYGTATETKALEEGITCQELCDKYHAVHASTYEWFGLDFDHFGRTSTKKHTEITQALYKEIEAEMTFTKTLTQLYCEHHKSFLADRFVEGTCPTCAYPDARGDQCDNCGKLLDPTDLLHPTCKLDKTTPVLRETEHIFLDLGKSQQKLEKWVDECSVKGEWSANTLNITKAWLKEGLRERCITRDLKWGVPVPKERFREKVFYVWFEACIGYPSITANFTDDWEKWWKNPAEVQLFQFMGKDNVPFHTVVFPSTLLNAKEEWTLLHHVSTTEYLQYESGKFSKSRSVGVFGNHVRSLPLPPAVWRYYLLANRPESSDSQFTWAGFVAANNNELLANLGNFVNRVVKFVGAKYGGVVPGATLPDLNEVGLGETAKTDFPTPEHKLLHEVNTLLTQYITTLESVKLRHALKLAMDISARGNAYLQDNKLDNKLFSDNRSRCDTVVATALNLAYLLSALIAPYMPGTATQIEEMLNVPVRRITDTWTGGDIREGHLVGKATYLFTLIKPEMVDIWRAKYGGSQAASDAPPEESKTSKRKAAKAAAAAAKTATAAAITLPEGFVKSRELEELEKRQSEVGEKVRTAKKDGNAGVVADALKELVALKESVREVLTKEVEAWKAANAPVSSS
ncbi:tRNA synthetases class I (M)-domain-containing protein [Fimicolochytrium jonesii]|uniref:tRNA synthetases class I (M)-domain-containing protein n=1 Tax=Fimicolochytrium jonesii TaxID=1396493 RepID=UPI0022FDC131|nr:tRNA synthetases class I (M)-domain-containing protein [Fimicolochytrium jonesii]KAI8817821.1 tRNA synthetases class I (M)-domain-containing protein [Fimicolochytrium jonesii]